MTLNLKSPPRPGELFCDQQGVLYEVTGIQTGGLEFKILYKRQDGETFNCYLEAFLQRFTPTQKPREFYGRTSKDQAF